MIEVARRAVEGALAAGASDAEAYGSEDRGREVRAYGGAVESLSAATRRGLGIRAWVGSRVGYAYDTDLSGEGIAALAARAVEVARVADEDEFAGPPAPLRPPPETTGNGAPELSDPSVAAWSTADVAELALAVERATLAADERVVGIEQAVYADSAETVAIASSTGIDGEYERSTCHAYVQALAEGDGGRETGFGFGLGRGPDSLDPAAIGVEGAERAAAMVGAGKPASRTCPVVLDPTVAAAFVAIVGRGLAAGAVQRGRSPFAGRLDDSVATDSFVLHDDGLDPDGPGSAPFDGEGLPHRRTTLIEAGTLRTYLYDTYTARRDGVASTASAGRGGYRSQPSVAPSNLIVRTGALSFAELLGEAGDGVLVNDVAGLHSGVNPVSGVFSVGASGRAIRGGDLAEPLREFTIASDLISMLGAVRACGAEPRWVPFGASVSTPPLLIAEMTVAGS
ncbi:MAG: TldD/PmbA family protein [Chloroflexota bacterium]